MTPIKRMEIVIDATHTPDLIDAIRAQGVAGYTVFRDVQGAGDRGVRRNDDPAGISGNCCVLIACEPGEMMKVVEAVRPLLETHGGMCLVSDAQWLKH